MSGRAPSLNGRAYALLGPTVETPLSVFNCLDVVLLCTSAEVGTLAC